MKKECLLCPTKGKVVSTLIIMGAVVIATVLMDILGDLLVPADLAEFLNNGAMMDALVERQEELVALGLKVLALGALLNLAAIYIAVCISFHYFKNE